VIRPESAPLNFQETDFLPASTGLWFGPYIQSR